MEARVFPLTCASLPLSPTPSSSTYPSLWPSPLRPAYAPGTGTYTFQPFNTHITWFQKSLIFPKICFLGPVMVVLRRSMKKEEPLLEGLPKEYYDDVSASPSI